MQLATKIWLVVFGLICVAIGLAHLMFGTATIIGGGRVNATIDSDMRFYALLFTAYGLAFVWCAADITQRARVANILGAIFFLGGLARLLAWVATGQPNWFYVAMIPVELVIPVVNYALLKRVSQRRGSAQAHASSIKATDAIPAD